MKKKYYVIFSNLVFTMLIVEYLVLQIIETESLLFIFLNIELEISILR